MKKNYWKYGLIIGLIIGIIINFVPIMNTIYSSIFNIFNSGSMFLIASKYFILNIFNVIIFGAVGLLIGFLIKKK